MRFADFSALRSLDDDFPITKHKESRTLDLPAPLGPRMQLKPGPKSISVCFAKDLKPCITIRFILVAFESCATARGADTLGMSPSFSMGISLYMYYLK